MENALIPIIVTIGISTLIIVASVLGTFVVLLNHLSSRIDRSEARMIALIEQSEARVTGAAAKDKAELQEEMRSNKAELLEAIRDTERRLTHRMERFEDKVDAQFEALRQELRQRAAEQQPVVGDD